MLIGFHFDIFLAVTFLFQCFFLLCQIILPFRSFFFGIMTASGCEMMVFIKLLMFILGFVNNIH